MKLLDLWKMIRASKQIITFFKHDCTIIDTGINTDLRKKYGNDRDFLYKNVHSISSEIIEGRTELFITLENEKTTDN